ncbi:Dipeptidyl-peptidase IV [Saliniradius amylolyticus]|uniref:Dipeptidyl-peptidase IV n=1 Tax=Saliniradius amylolyticus TaxID=2183582 RepID=A0A2S2E5S8_9ALTE|nr:S9 family peptidase [Saliniradius amylolyticus]AWL13015.1 Dipeptidyl-peptidase IV [Saliniradius amylolyticus]
MKKLMTALAAVGLVSTPASANSIDIEQIFQSPSLEGSAPKMLKVSPDGQRVTFLKGKEDDYERYDLWEYHVESGETRMLVNSDDLHQGPEELSDEEKARRERMRVHGSGIMSYHWSDDGKALLFPLAGDAYYYRLGDDNARQLLDTEAFETDIRFSPRAKYISYVREQNLYVMDIDSGKEVAITTEGGGPIKFGMAEFVAQEEMSRMTGYWWAPDESQIAFTRVDESPVEEVTRSEIYADSIKMITQRYPSTGTDNVKIDLGVKAIGQDDTQWVDLGDNEDIYLARVNWLNDSRHLSYQWQSRDQQRLELRKYDTRTAEQSNLLTETSDTWINLHFDLHFLKDSEQFIWASERDGFKHLYLYNNDGELVRQLTQGEWVVDKIEAIDEASKAVYFTGRADTPIERHLYRVSLEGGDIERVSQRSGFHGISFSKDASIYVDRFSTVNTPPQVSLHKAGGEQLTWLEQNAVQGGHPLADYQDSWVKPEFGTFNTEDGTTIHYRLYKPKQVNGKHPAIVYHYGGPHAQVVTNSWGGNRGLLMQHWVSKGYVVFSIDNRGSYKRGKAFEDAIYKNMGDIEVKDQVEGVKFLTSKPYVDEKRVGVYGHSYGGYMTLMSMFKAGDVYAAGVSGAPVTDWLLYDTHYTERYMGHPDENAEGYTNSSVFPYVDGLKGKLLIYHGMADDNVLFKHSTKLYKTLQDKALLFEMMDYPGKKHSLRGKQTGIHLYNTITHFFDRNLMR